MSEVKPKIRDRRRFVLDPMRRVQRAAHREIAELLASIGYGASGRRT